MTFLEVVFQNIGIVSFVFGHQESITAIILAVKTQHGRFKVDLEKPRIFQAILIKKRGVQSSRVVLTIITIILKTTLFRYNTVQLLLENIFFLVKYVDEENGYNIFLWIDW